MLRPLTQKWDVPRKPVRFADKRLNEVVALYAGSGGRVRILKEVDPNTFEPFDVSQLSVAQVYVVAPRLAELLILDGCADSMMPAFDRAADRPPRKSKR